MTGGAAIWPGKVQLALFCALLFFHCVTPITRVNKLNLVASQAYEGLILGINKPKQKPTPNSKQGPSTPMSNHNSQVFSSTWENSLCSRHWGAVTHPTPVILNHSIKSAEKAGYPPQSTVFSAIGSLSSVTNHAVSPRRPVLSTGTKKYTKTRAPPSLHHQSRGPMMGWWVSG